MYVCVVAPVFTHRRCTHHAVHSACEFHATSRRTGGSSHNTRRTVRSAHKHGEKTPDAGKRCGVTHPSRWIHATRRCGGAHPTHTSQHSTATQRRRGVSNSAHPAALLLHRRRHCCCSGAQRTEGRQAAAVHPPTHTHTHSTAHTHTPPHNHKAKRLCAAPATTRDNTGRDCRGKGGVEACRDRHTYSRGGAPNATGRFHP